MPSPFPGMDPYLEATSLWPDVHLSYIAVMAELLTAELRPAYFAQIVHREYLIDRFDPARPVVFPDLRMVPEYEECSRSNSAMAVLTRSIPEMRVIDEEVHDARLELIEVHSRKIATVIEFLSPANKVPGSEGMRSFAEKRREVLSSDAHWVEIDLLRNGARILVEGHHTDSAYRVHLSRVQERPQSWVWPIALQQRLPKIQIPLRPEHPEAELDLQAVLNLIYQRAGYDLILDYRSDPPDPPLLEAQRQWIQEILKLPKGNA